MAVVSAIVAAVSATVSTIAAGAAAAGAMVAAGAATAAGMAAVGSALVAVSSVVGVAGLATSVIGLATGNKDLLKAGKVMGYIGLGSAVLGGVAGGIGGMMEGGAGFFEGAKGAFTGGIAGADSAPTTADVNATGSTMFSSEAGSSVTAPMTSVPGVDQASQAYTLPPSSMSADGAVGNLYNSPIEGATLVDPSSLTTPGSVNPSVAGSSPLPPPVSSPVSAPDAASGVPTPMVSNQASAITPPEVINQADLMHRGLVDSATGGHALRLNTGVEPFASNYTPGGAGAALDTSVNPLPGYTPPPANASVGQNYTMEGLKQMVDPFKAVSPAAPAAPGMWASMPEWAKYAAMTSGMQGLTGLASGYYQGLSAEEKLKFEKMVNDQRQQQVDLINTRSNYAPRVTFNRGSGGLVNA